MDGVTRGIDVADANAARQASPIARLLFSTGPPGCGKTEVVVQSAQASALNGGRVLIGCPAGVLVATYRDRMPSNELITVQTIRLS
eukprot:12335318-Karenia_brevis.AAC.1